MLTGSAARSAREAATMAREASGSPHVSTTLAAPAGFVRASTTATSERRVGSVIRSSSAQRTCTQRRGGEKGP